jgi:hypothetical protein
MVKRVCPTEEWATDAVSAYLPRCLVLNNHCKAIATSGGNLLVRGMFRHFSTLALSLCGVLVNWLEPGFWFHFR